MLLRRPAFGSHELRLGGDGEVEGFCCSTRRSSTAGCLPSAVDFVRRFLNGHKAMVFRGGLWWNQRQLKFRRGTLREGKGVQLGFGAGRDQLTGSEVGAGLSASG